MAQPGSPDAKRFSRSRAVQNRRQNLITQNVKNFTIAKEPCDVDQQVAPEHRDFLRQLLEKFQILFGIGQLRDADAPLDAARHRTCL